MLSKDLGYIDVDEFNMLTEKIKFIIRMLNNLIKSLKNFKLKTENRKLYNEQSEVYIPCLKSTPKCYL